MSEISISPFPNRQGQHNILQRLAAEFPNQVDVQSWRSELSTLAQDLQYLHEHGLVDAKFSQGLGTKKSPWAARITAKGIDFIADDGGLSAILGVITIKLHDDTLKSLIEAKILQSDLSQPDKKRWTDQLHELPAETTKHLVLKLVDLGLANVPAALGVIGSALGLGAGG